jgi:uncharacterized protein (UPF0335 family)
MTPTEMHIDALMEKIERLEAENARLREALELLAKDNSGICCECLEIKDIAREALKGGE